MVTVTNDSCWPSLPQVKKENPEAKMGEMSKIIGEKWKGLTDEEKAPYQKKAEADKV